MRERISRHTPIEIPRRKSADIIDASIAVAMDFS
jgi:hypothetical protein